MNLPPTNANDRRNIAIGFVLRRIPETGSIRVHQLEDCARRDFEPLGEQDAYVGTRVLRAWYRYQNFSALMGKLANKGYIILENDGRRVTKRKDVLSKTAVSRGRNYGHYMNDPRDVISTFLKAYPIPVLDELANL